MNSHVGPNCDNPEGLTSDSPVGQNYARDVAAAVSGLVGQLLRTSHTYLVLGFYFDRVDVAQAGASRFFLDLAREKREGAERLLRLHSQRGGGGGGVFEIAQGPPQEEWGSSRAALEAALHLEGDLHRALLELHGLGVARGDPLLCAFLEHHFLEAETRLLATLHSHLAQLRRLPGPWAALQDCVLGWGRPGPR